MTTSTIILYQTFLDINQYDWVCICYKITHLQIPSDTTNNNLASHTHFSAYATVQHFTISEACQLLHPELNLQVLPYTY